MVLVNINEGRNSMQQDQLGNVDFSSHTTIVLAELQHLDVHKTNLKHHIR